MTNAEARAIAEEILLHLKTVLTLTQDQPRKLFAALNNVLEDVVASRTGLIEPDQPIDTPWSMMDITMLEVLREKWLPITTGLPASSQAELSLRYEDHSDGETVQKISD